MEGDGTRCGDGKVKDSRDFQNSLDDAVGCVRLDSGRSRVPLPFGSNPSKKKNA